MHKNNDNYTTCIIYELVIVICLIKLQLSNIKYTSVFLCFLMYKYPVKTNIT